MGQSGRGDRTPNLRLRPGDQEGQACQCGLGHALPPDPPVSTTGLQFVGVRPGPAPDSIPALRNEARGCLEGAFQEFRGLPSRHRGSRILRQTSSLRSKLTFSPLPDTRIDRGGGVPSFDERMDIALVEVDFDDPTTNVRGRRALAIAKPTPRGY